MNLSSQQWIDGLKAQAEKGIKPNRADKQFLKEIKADERAGAVAANLEQGLPLSRIATQWGKLETVQKVDAGMWGAGMLLGAFGVVNAAKYSVARDDVGKAHIQWSQVGVLLLQAAMAAGCGFMTHRALNGHSVA